jgi:hypothetical protein
MAEKTKWEMDYDNYEAEFSIGKASYSALFSKEGAWMGTETLLKASELPKAIKDALSKEFGELSAYKVETSEKVETPATTRFELLVVKGEKRYEMFFTEKGEIIDKHEQVKESDKDE